jgi:hypothetical protein
VAGAAASFGCSSLLDLDVQYAQGVDAGTSSSPLLPDGTSDGPGGADDAPNAADAAEQALPEADSASAEAESRDGAGDAESSPDVRDASAPDVSNDSPPDVSIDSPPDVSNDSPPDVSIDSPPPSVIQCVQHSSGAVNFMPGTLTVSFPNSVTQNDTIVVAADGTNTVAPTVTDSLQNPFAQAATVVAMAGSATSAWIFYAPVVTQGADSITVTLPGIPMNSLLEVYILEYSGIAALDSAMGQAGTTLDMHSGFVATTAPGDLIFGYGVTGIAVAGAGFNTRETLDGNLTEDEIFVSRGNVEATATMTAGNNWAMLVAAFKAR